jgi:hypothetical protein
MSGSGSAGLEEIATLCRLHGVRKLEAPGTWLSFTPSGTVACATKLSRAGPQSMPHRDPGVYLEDIEYYAGAAVRFISIYSLEQYLADENRASTTRRATTMLITTHVRPARGIHPGPIGWNRAQLIRIRSLSNRNAHV